MIILIFKVLHIACAAVWWGVPMSMSRDIRTTICLGQPHAGALISRVNRSRVIAIGAGLATIISGIGLVLLVGGFALVPTPIHIALTLSFILLSSEYLWEGRTWSRLIECIRSRESDEVTRGVVRRMSLIGGLQHTLWFFVLVLMVFRHY